MRVNEPKPRWVDVTPMVFVINTAVGWSAMWTPALFSHSGPPWLNRVAWLCGVAIPPTLSLVVWRAYGGRVGARAYRRRAGYWAPGAAAAAPLASVGAPGAAR